MLVEIHRHEIRELQKTRIDLPPHARIGRRDDRHGIPFEPVDRLLFGELVDRRFAFPRVDRPAHHGERRGLAEIAPARHHRRRRKTGDGRLADRQHMRIRPQEMQKIDDVVDVVGQVEPILADGDQPRVLPIGGVDVMIGQHLGDRAAQQRREMPR